LNNLFSITYFYTSSSSHDIHQSIERNEFTFSVEVIPLGAGEEFNRFIIMFNGLLWRSSLLGAGEEKRRSGGEDREKEKEKEKEERVSPHCLLWVGL